MFTDIVGFSRLTNQNPLRARELNEEHQKIIRQYLIKYEGLERQTTGDGFFLEFKSAVQALSCAIEVQQSLHDRNLTRSSENQIQIRIGLHLGDIFEKGSDIFGDSVNVAARLEALAEPQGICLSRTFYELVRSSWSENKFSSMGLFKLKNIDGKTEAFKFKFGWEKTKIGLFKKLWLNLKTIVTVEQWTLASLFLLSLMLLLFIFTKVFVPQLQSAQLSSRKPSSNLTEVTEKKLDSGWTYSVNQTDWNEFILKESWRYADILRGAYTLKNEFQVTQKPAEPAIILGLISDSHRVFLNGHYIGGSEHLSDLAIYSFDPSFLKEPAEKNLLEVKATMRVNLNPGIVLLDDVQPRLGEFSQLTLDHGRYYFHFYILKNVYFVFSFVIFLMSLVYAVYLKNKSEIFYSSLFLLIGSIGYVYYNPWVISKFDYQFLRFIRLSGLLMSSLVLISGYLAVRKKSSWCSRNNILTLFVGLICFFIFNFYPFATAEAFVSSYNQFLFLGSLYVFVVLACCLYTEFSQGNEFKKDSSIEAFVFLAFTFLSLLNILGAFKNGQSDAYFSAQWRAVFYDVGGTVTFLFAVARISIAVFEFTLQKRQNMLNRNKDEFFIELTRVVAEAQSTFEKINRIQKLAHHFLKSEKSILYLVDAKNPKILNLHSANGYTSEIENTKSIEDGFFGYVLHNRRPLLLEDISRDFRFENLNSSELQGTKSGACMLFPLIAEDRIVGIMAFLEKENGHPFNMGDLELGIKMSSFIALLISSSKEYQKVS